MESTTPRLAVEPDRPAAALPPIGAPGAHRRPPQALRYHQTITAIGTVAFAAVAIVVMLVVRTELVTGIVLWAVLPLIVVSGAFELLVGNRWEQRHYSYTVTDDVVYITSGRWLRSTVTLPTPHVLNVETQQGPLQRSLGLMEVRFTTITGQQVLGPIEPDEAERVREQVTRTLRRHADA